MATADIFSVPEAAEVWKIGKSRYLVYFVPNTKPPVPMLFRIATNNAYEELGSPKPKLTLTWAQAKKKGVLQLGISDQVQNLNDHPFAAFITNYERDASVNPMLRDKEVLALYAQSILEGRPITESELSTTKWWQSRTEGERQWALLAASDPSTAQERLGDNRASTRELLMAQGMENPSEELIGYLSDKFTQGIWSEEEYRQAIKRANDPYAPGASVFAGADVTGMRAVKMGDRFFLRDANNNDYELKSEGAIARYANMEWESLGGGGREEGSKHVGFKEVSSVNVKGDAEEHLGDKPTGYQADRPNVARVIDLISQWLGPMYKKGFSDEQIGRWASRITYNPNAEGELLETLKRQRLALFPEYENENLSYEDIAGPWRALYMNVWGTTPDELDNPLFEQIVRMNDRGKAETLLRKEGLKVGNSNVASMFTDSLRDMMGSGAVRGVI